MTMLNPAIQGQSLVSYLLTYYSLEADRYPKPVTKFQILERWLRSYPEPWVRLALIESLYQGRYKAFSVEKLLAFWQRRGQPIYHFSYEFESMVSRNIPHRLGKASPSTDSGNEVHLPDFSASAPSSTSSLAESAPLPSESTVANGSANTPSSESQSLAGVEHSRARSARSSDQAASAFASSKSVLESVLESHQILPLKLTRSSLEPIHQFMPEAQPIEFCEKLEAIARSSP
ncbi:MAG TPA: hypothetical protein V6D19_01655 [Stenomitos sp.]